MNEPPIIDHDPEEPKIDRKPESFRSIFTLVAFSWAGIAYAYGVEWRSLFLGCFTGMIFMLWASIRLKHLW